MNTNLNLIDSIVIVKGNRGYYAYLRFKDKFYDRNITNISLEMLHSVIETYLHKNLGIRTR